MIGLRASYGQARRRGASLAGVAFALALVGAVGGCVWAVWTGQSGSDAAESLWWVAYGAAVAGAFFAGARTWKTPDLVRDDFGPGERQVLFRLRWRALMARTAGVAVVAAVPAVLSLVAEARGDGAGGLDSGDAAEGLICLWAVFAVALCLALWTALFVLLVRFQVVAMALAGVFGCAFGGLALWSVFMGWGVLDLLGGAAAPDGGTAARLVVALAWYGVLLWLFPTLAARVLFCHSAAPRFTGGRRVSFAACVTAALAVWGVVVFGCSPWHLIVLWRL